MNILSLGSGDSHFISIQGEGRYSGYPAVFTRLAHCNLSCIGFSSPENPTGCDSAISWMHPIKFTFEKLIKQYEDFGFVEPLRRGDLQIFTGGEPLAQQKALLEFTKLAFWETWDIKYPNIHFETNATILPDKGWELWAPTYICSPKTSNNGDPENKRYKPEVLEWHSSYLESYFKFVITKPEDLEEIESKYVQKFNIPKNRVWLMPEGTTRARMNEMGPMVADLCIKHGYNFSPRLQVYLWEAVLGK